MKEIYFSLFNFVYLVKGAKRGALYDLKTGDIYSIDEIATSLLEKSEKGLSLQEISQQIFLPLTEIINYCKNLEKNNLGKFETQRNIPKKIALVPPKKLLNFIWLEMTHQCNLKCVHCYVNSGPASSNKEKNLLSLSDWQKIIREAYVLGCRYLQFIGGEPLCYDKQSLKKLIEEAGKIGYHRLEIFTNCTLLDDDFIAFLKEYNVQIATSLYGPTSRIHDSITQTKGSFDKTVENINKLLKREITIRAAIITMDLNRNFTQDTVKFLRGIGVTNIKVDNVRPAGRALTENVCLDFFYDSPDQLLFPKIKYNFFNKVHFGHNCFLEKICITPQGKVIPCIMIRDIVYGNIFNNSLEKILNNNKAKKIRETTKDKIEKCQNCEFRYGCFDCRVKIVKNQSSCSLHNLYNPSLCLYNPYLGEIEKIKKKGGDKNEKTRVVQDYYQ